MAIIRNLTGSTIALDDLSGITLPASADYNLLGTPQEDIDSSNDLSTNISNGNIVFLDSTGTPLSQQESENILIRAADPVSAISVEKDGVPVTGTPHNIINFAGTIFTTANNTNGKITITSAGLEAGDNISQLTNDAGYISSIASSQLNDLSDVSVGSATNGQVLTFNNTSGDWESVSPTPGVTDHALLSNIGTNTHAQIDTHLADSTVHFTEASISITESQISDLGNYEPANANIQSHIADSTVHFTEASISITESQISDLQSYSLTSHVHEGVDIDATGITAGLILTADGSGNSTWDTITASVVSYIHLGSITSQDISGVNNYEEAINWDSSIYSGSDFTHSTVTNNTRVAFNFTGRVLVSGSIGVLNNNPNRTTLMSGYSINGGATIFRNTRRNYGRGASYGDISLDWQVEVEVTSGDYIELISKVDDSDGPNAVVNTIPAECDLVIRRIDIGIQGEPGPPGGITDHTLLSNIGTNTHAQIDNHISDSTVHFTQAAISITESQISDLGNYEPANANIQSHISDSTVHFTEASISITESQISDLQSYLLDITSSNLEELANVTASPTTGDYLAWDGSNWTEQTPATASPLPNVQARRTTSLNNVPTSWVDFSFDTTDLENDVTVIDHHNTNRDRFTVLEDGLYQITFSFVVDDESMARVRVNDSTVIPGSEYEGGAVGDVNDTNQAITHVFFADLTANDFVTMQVRARSTFENIFAGAVFTITKQQGATGATGPAGAGTTVVVQDEGSNIANTPHSTFNFTGTGVTATDAGSGVTSINIPGFTPTPPKLFYGHNGGTVQTLTSSFSTVNISTNVRIDGIYSISANTITVSESGWYKITYSVGAEAASNARSGMECQLERNNALVPGSMAWAYHRRANPGEDTATAEVLIQLTSGDTVRVRMRERNGSIRTMANGCRLLIDQIETT